MRSAIYWNAVPLTAVQSSTSRCLKIQERRFSIGSSLMLMMLSKARERVARTLGISSRQHEVKHRLGVDPLDRMGQRRRFGQIVRGDASEDVHGPFAGGAADRRSRWRLPRIKAEERRLFSTGKAVIRSEYSLDNRGRG